MKKRVCLCTAHRSIFLRSKPFHGPTFFSNAFRSHTVHLPPYHKSHPKNFYRKRSSLLPKFQKHLLRDKKTLRLDRKSTRLNSSHVAISYAVFCLKKKNK